MSFFSAMDPGFFSTKTTFFHEFGQDFFSTIIYDIIRGIKCIFLLSFALVLFRDKSMIALTMWCDKNDWVKIAEKKLVPIAEKKKLFIQRPSNHPMFTALTQFFNIFLLRFWLNRQKTWKFCYANGNDLSLELTNTEPLRQEGMSKAKCPGKNGTILPISAF